MQKRLHLKFETEGLRISTNEDLTDLINLGRKPDYVPDVNQSLLNGV